MSLFIPSKQHNISCNTQQSFVFVFQLNEQLAIIAHERVVFHYQEYMVENEALRSENGEHLLGRDRLKKEQQYIVRENDRLQKQVEELQRCV